MHSKKLTFPFKWEDRRPLIQEQVLFVPSYYEKHHQWSFPSFEDPSLFGRKGPIFIEYCSGNGDWVVERAKKSPGDNWIAVEKRFDRIRKIWSKRQNGGLPNLFIVCGEALTFTRYYLRTESVDGIFINFPDPWPKPKHAKHRLLQGIFIEELFRLVVKGGSATIVTDDLTYRDQIIQEMHLHPGWKSSCSEPFYQTQWKDYGSSWFERLWKEKGRMIYYMSFIKQ